MVLLHEVLKDAAYSQLTVYPPLGYGFQPYSPRQHLLPKHQCEAKKKKQKTKIVHQMFFEKISGTATGHFCLYSIGQNLGLQLQSSSYNLLQERLGNVISILGGHVLRILFLLKKEKRTIGKQLEVCHILLY